MLFQTTQAHEDLRARIRAFAEEEVKPLVFQMDQGNEFPADAVKKLGEMGLMGIPYPKEYGGAGLDVLCYAIAVEVLARVKSQLRRYTLLGAKPETAPERGIYTVGGVTLNEDAKSVTVDGESVSLTPLEFNILQLLIRSPGRIYSSSQIYELVWNENSLGAETSVAVHIRHLRQKIEINPSEPRYLKVVWGLGYKMEDLRHEKE